MPTNTILITGATAGIGEVTALELARTGATVVGVGRNPAKCAAVAAHIRQVTGNPNVEFLVADLAVQAQIRQLATEFCQKYARLDVLINNAGAVFFQRQVSADGIEMTWALNHLNYFLLTNLLLERLQASAPARIINVASAAHQTGKINFADLEGRQRYSAMGAYAQSKLANILFTKELARRLAGSGVTANTLHPGFIASNFAMDNFVGWRRVFAWLYRGIQRVAARSPEQGAATPIYLATDPTVATISGEYFVNKRIRKPAAAAQDGQVAQRLWTVSEQMVGLGAS